MIRQVSQVFVRSLLVLSFSISAFAEAPPQRLLIATSDAFPGDYELSLTVDAHGKAQTIEYKSPTDQQTFQISGLPAGLPLLTDSGRDVLVLQGEGFDPASGGELKLDYLVNGVTGKRRFVDIAIERAADVWQLHSNDSAGRRVVTSAFFKANRLLGKTVGISSVTFNTQ